MFPLLKTLSMPLLSLVLLVMASGLFTTFVSIRLELEGYSNEAIGLIASAMYVGILAGSIRLGRFIMKQGHAKAFIAFALIITGLIAAQSVWLNPYYWGALRFIGGICMAGIFIVIESWMLLQGKKEQRGQVLSLYLAIFYGALSTGQLLLSDPYSSVPFIIAGSLTLASVIPLFAKQPLAPKLELQTTHLPLKVLIRFSPLGFAGGIVSGMLLAAIYGLVPVFGTEIGLSTDAIARLMAVLIFGGLALQWPIGHLADRYDRKRVLMFASIMTTLVGALLPHAGSSWGMYLLAWFFGGFSFTIYPLSMAYTCEGLQEEWIVPATGGFVLSYSIGAIGGPVIAPLAMALFGPGGIFYFIGALTFSLALFGWLYREGLKNWETGKEAASIFQSGKSGHALEHAANEDEKLKAKPTSPETNSSVTSGITKNPTR